MKANELRIGNLVYLWNNALEYSEFEINYTAIRQIHQGIEAYTPIPLTEEWLLKFGFKHNTILYNNYSMIFDEYVCSVQFYDGVWLFSSDLSNAGCYVFTDFKYVHELQNLVFALAKEELKIEEL